MASNERVLAALRKNRDIADKAGLTDRVKRIDKRIKDVEKPAPKKAATTKAAAEPKPAEPKADDKTAPATKENGD